MTNACASLSEQRDLLVIQLDTVCVPDIVTHPTNVFSIVAGALLEDL